MAVDLKIIVDDGFNHGATEEAILKTIDFSDWQFYPEDDDKFMQSLKGLIQRRVADAFQNTLHSFPPTIEFEHDSTSITVAINIGSSWNDGIIYFTASIEQMVDDFIECSTDPEVVDEARIELAEYLSRCADKLRKAKP